MKTHLKKPIFYLNTSAMVLLFALLATPVRADILYLANTDWSGSFGANYLQTFASDGLGSQFANLSGVGSPFGLAFDSDANLYVGMQNGINGTIMRFTPGGVGSVYLSGLWAPTVLAFDGAGNLFVADNGVIKEFTPGGVESVFATDVVSLGMAFDSAGNLYASDNGAGMILKFAPDGSRSVFASGLSAPEGIAFDRAGNLFAANIGNRTISEITSAGVSSLFASDDLVNPVGLAFDGSGNLYVGDADGVKKFTPGGVGSVFANAPYANGYPTYLAFTDDAGVPLPLINQIPEPATWVLIGLGLAVLLGLQRARGFACYRACQGPQDANVWAQSVHHFFGIFQAEVFMWLAASGIRCRIHAENAGI